MSHNFFFQFFQFFLIQFNLFQSISGMSIFEKNENIKYSKIKNPSNFILKNSLRKNSLKINSIGLSYNINLIFKIKIDF